MTDHSSSGEALETHSLQDYVRFCVFQAGSAAALAKHLGFSTGSRVGDWLAGKNGGRPSELTCLKLARFSGHDPIQILRLAEQTEMADLLADFFADGRDRPYGRELYMIRLRAELGKAKATIDWLLGELEGK